MTAYVDDSRFPERLGGLDARWSRLAADTTEELDVLVQTVGITFPEVSHRGSSVEHVLVSDHLRAHLIARYGVVAIPESRFGELVIAKAQLAAARATN